MGEVKVRWAVRVKAAQGRVQWVNRQEGTNSWYADKPERLLFESRREAMRAAVSWPDTSDARLVKVTLRPKAKLPEKSLAELCRDSYSNGDFIDPWEKCPVRADWERAASAVEAEVLKRRGLK